MQADSQYIPLPPTRPINVPRDVLELLAWPEELEPPRPAASSKQSQLLAVPLADLGIFKSVMRTVVKNDRRGSRVVTAEAQATAGHAIAIEKFLRDALSKAETPHSIARRIRHGDAKLIKKFIDTLAKELDAKGLKMPPSYKGNTTHYLVDVLTEMIEDGELAAMELSKVSDQPSAENMLVRVDGLIEVAGALREHLRKSEPIHRDSSDDSTHSVEATDDEEFDAEVMDSDPKYINSTSVFDEPFFVQDPRAGSLTRTESRQEIPELGADEDGKPIFYDERLVRGSVPVANGSLVPDTRLPTDIRLSLADSVH